jgi:hypothetical protein
VKARVGDLRKMVGMITLISRLPGASFTLDGEPVEPVRLGTPMRVNAGTHRIVASKEGCLSKTVEVRVLGEQPVTVEVDPAPIAPTERVIVQTRVVEKRASRWWIGIVVGAAVLAVAAGATTAGVMLSGTDEEFFHGNVTPGLQRIRP